MSLTRAPVSRGPKRIIQRNNSRIDRNTVDNTVQGITMHTVTERETLTRLILTGWALFDGTASTQRGRLLMSIFRNGQRVAPVLAIGETFDVNDPLEVLIRDSFGVTIKTAVGEIVGSRTNIDTKIQRKLMPGDLIVFEVVSSGSTAIFSWIGDCTLWLKLA